MRTLLTLFCYYLLLNSQFIMAQELSCGPPIITNICNSQDVDQSGATGALLPNTALNPIDLFSGNKYLREVDLYPHPEAPDLEIVRHYNSMSPYYAALGGQWKLSYDARLKVSPNANPVLHQANGNLRHLNVSQGHLETQENRFIWHYLNGDKWHFNKSGWLIQVQRHGDASLFIHRHQTGKLTNLIDRISQKKHQLKLHYESKSNTPLLQFISSNSGNIHYVYSTLASSKLYALSQVNYPDQRRVYYHYESDYQQQNPWALTGKSIQQSTDSAIHRVRSWVYDNQGRAIFVMAEQTHQWVRLHYPNIKRPAQTRLQSPNGITYVDFFSPQNRTIKSVSGAHCWACPPAFTHTPHKTQFEHFDVHHSHAPQQQIEKITGDFNGWPKLQLDYNAQGQLITWQNELQRPTQLSYDKGRAKRIQFANGDQQQVSYNSLQQLVTIDYQSAQQILQTQLKRPSPHHLYIFHPNEKEQLTFTKTGQVLDRKIQRQLTTPMGEVKWHYQESFIYDDQDRLLRHQLPEGGVLIYTWLDQHLKSIEWENKQGHRKNILKRTLDIKKNQQYEFGNGLIQQHLISSNERHTVVKTSEKTWWHQHLTLDTTSSLAIQKQDSFPTLNAINPHMASYFQHQYVYNKQQQLIIEKDHDLKPYFYAWHNSGAMAAHNQVMLPTIKRDHSGLATSLKQNSDEYQMTYNAMRRLEAVYKAAQPIQKNSHNAYAYRIYAQHHAQNTQQFFLYHGKKMVAEYTIPLQAKLLDQAVHPISRRYIYLHHQPVGLIDYQLDAKGELLMMHSSHLGAVHLITDAQQQPRWIATFDAFGAVKKHGGDVDLHLRLEGQYYDIATGWHDNLLRTYLPQQGHYLEPDPLGPNPTSQLLGYSNQQPLNHTDPWGLVLFSFDGTRYDASSGGVVFLLDRAAQDPSFYVAGPGNPYQVDWDAAVSYTTDQILQQQWSNLLNYLKQVQSSAPSTTIPIDIIAFSRGAAISLHFANQIMRHSQNGFFSYTDSYGEQVQACIQPRFMGLLDNVAQMGILGSKNHRYDFSVSPAWQWVVHGVAMHEHRFLFPSYSIGTGSNSQEIGLVGAHGDLGGGYPMVDGPNVKPLSDVALQWILWNARAQGMQFEEIGLKKYGDYAYMHDESLFFEFDRKLQNHTLPVDFDNPLRERQSQHPIYGAKARAAVHSFIDYALQPEEKMDNRIAKVDLAAYYRWLDQTIHWSPPLPAR